MDFIQMIGMEAQILRNLPKFVEGELLFFNFHSLFSFSMGEVSKLKPKMYQLIQPSCNIYLEQKARQTSRRITMRKIFEQYGLYQLIHFRFHFTTLPPRCLKGFLFEIYFAVGLYQLIHFRLYLDFRLPNSVNNSRVFFF